MPTTQDFVRRYALSLPEVEASAHHGRPDLRVRGRIFATLPTETNTVNLKILPENLDALRNREPAVFSRVWGDRWMGVQLDGVDEEVVKGLVTDAWRLTAPKRLVRDLEE